MSISIYQFRAAKRALAQQDLRTFDRGIFQSCRNCSRISNYTPSHCPVYVRVGELLYVHQPPLETTAVLSSSDSTFSSATDVISTSRFCK